MILLISTLILLIIKPKQKSKTMRNFKNFALFALMGILFFSCGTDKSDDKPEKKVEEMTSEEAFSASTSEPIETAVIGTDIDTKTNVNVDALLDEMESLLDKIATLSLASSAYDRVEDQIFDITDILDYADMSSSQESRYERLEDRFDKMESADDDEDSWDDSDDDWGNDDDDDWGDDW